MTKRKSLCLIASTFILLGLVLLGAGCKDQSGKSGAGKEESVKKGLYLLEEQGVPSSKNSLRVSANGRIVYLFDSDNSGQTDSIVVSNPDGKDKKIIKIKGNLLDSKVQIDDTVMDVDQTASKVVFAATPPSERGEYGGPKNLYLLDVAAETVKKLPNQDLSERFKGAGWADAQSAAISPDGEKIAFGVRIWGIDLGAAYDIASALAVVNSDGSGLKLLKEKDASEYLVGIDNFERVFFAQKQDQYDWSLSVINTDGSGEENLGIKISGGSISVNSNGMVSGVLDEKDNPFFVADSNGKILAKGGDPWGAVEISENGKLVLAVEWDKGLFLYDLENNLEKEAVLDKSEGNCAVHDLDDSGRIIACRLYKTGELFSIVR